MAEIISPTLLSLGKEELAELLKTPCSTCVHAIWFGAPIDPLIKSRYNQTAQSLSVYRAYCNLMHATAPQDMWICDGQSQEPEPK